MKESDLQKQVAKYLDNICRIKGGYWFHVANETGQRAKVGLLVKRKAQGVKAGVPDCIILKDGNMYYLELKIKGGRVSDNQKNSMENLDNNGASGIVAYNYTDACEYINIIFNVK